MNLQKATLDPEEALKHIELIDQTVNEITADCKKIEATLNDAAVATNFRSLADINSAFQGNVKLLKDLCSVTGDTVLSTKRYAEQVEEMDRNNEGVM